MLRIALSSALTAAFVTFGSAAYAQTAKSDCSTEIKRAEAAMPRARDAGKTAMMKSELEIAREMATKNDEKACMTHVQNAMKNAQ